MLSIKNLAIVIGLTLSISAVALGQTEAPLKQDHQNRSERLRRGDHQRILRRQGVKMYKALDLTEEQRQQLRNIRQRQFDSTKAQREELMQLAQKRRAGTITEEDRLRARTLHSEMKAFRQSLHSEVEGILTPEQRAQLEETRKQRQERRAERLERGREKMRL
jgi:Spy/CpxP family protein refolding chaperone